MEELADINVPEKKQYAYGNPSGKYTCCIQSCQSKEPPLFSFPKDLKLKTLWEDATGKTDVRPNSYTK